MEIDPRSSDLDETWWKLFPGVSRSFLNSSGTKITIKNTKKNEIQNSMFGFSAYVYVYILMNEKLCWQGCANKKTPVNRGPPSVEIGKLIG